MSFGDLPLQAIDPQRRIVLLAKRSWDHINERRPELLNDLDAILKAIEHPDVHEMDERPGRERFYIAVVTDRVRWLRVVVDFNVEPAVVVTAFIQRKKPA